MAKQRPAIPSSATKRLAQLAREFEIISYTEAHSPVERAITVHLRRRVRKPKTKTAKKK